jgi:hypothetical protein
MGLVHYRTSTRRAMSMSTVVSSANVTSLLNKMARNAAPSDEATSNHAKTDEAQASFSFRQIVEMLLSGKGLRLVALAAAVFFAWKALRGLRSLFWVAFGLGWALFWSRGGFWF